MKMENNNSLFVKNSLKLKPRPILFNKNNEGPIAKKLKLTNENGHYNNNVNHAPRYHNSSFNIQQQRKSLPIFQKRNELIDIIRQHKTLIILGETGSGKSTQVPQYIYSSKLHNDGRIGITQPRRVATVTVSMRVAQECGGLPVGDLVGYTIRFEDVTSQRTKIKFLTDGMLLREATVDKLLMDYSVIILDEAHERTLHSDVLFGIVKNAQKTRELRGLAPLKVLIMSATMDVDQFSRYFDCRVVYIQGRTFPVNVFYTVKPHDDYQEACVATFFKIHSQAPPNHGVLIFLTGQEEIEACAHQIRLLLKDTKVEGPPVRVQTLYAAQSSNQQMQAFQPAPAGTRKVIISTNIAETSVTITGVKYVIDSGMVKVRTFHPITGLEVLKVQRISHEQAWQRTGRAGRESEGYCYRLYTKSQFELMKKNTVPEIQRTNLNSVVLQLLSMNIHALNFDFMDAPPKNSVQAAFQQLKQLGAIEPVENVALTAVRKRIAIDIMFNVYIMAIQCNSCQNMTFVIHMAISIYLHFFTQQTFHPITGLEVLKVQRISHEQAWQRTGRAGRESEGYCYRLYTKSQFELMKKNTVPEIQRTNLNSVVLQLLSMNIHALNFDFMDAPPKNSVQAAFQQLKQLGAIESVENVALTAVGKRMASFPVDPRFSKILLSAESFNCVEEAAIVVAILCSESIFVNPPSKIEMAQNMRRKFHSPLGDHITSLNVFKEFINIKPNSRRSWCHEHFINLNNILYVREVRQQLRDICERNNVKISSCGSNIDSLRQCMLTGLSSNVAKLYKDRQYMTLDKKHLTLIHLSSSIYGQQPGYVVYSEIVQTSKCYIKNLTAVEGEWVTKIMPEYANGK